MRRVKSNPKSQSKPSSSSSASSSRLKKIPSLLLFALIFFYCHNACFRERRRVGECGKLDSWGRRECCECVEWGLGKNFSHSGNSHVSITLWNRGKSSKMNHLDDDEGVFQGQFTKREKIIIFGGVGCEQGIPTCWFLWKRSAYEWTEVAY